ncbi:unnamed protein product [Rotaria sp. Silwood1]|nr:unnamed protein product [Rotaria sp. Silwood1]CAF1142678.1 unnamed protein product [Rotaria sp. Silwood1]CAF3428877.1 unnamed protein product [Rotaria sp. Silwood1]CAF3486106.1 unnamed protein product [Rotaria sp. Silwood1]CAF4601416.1 unnamed protein product [Rotaria sp. Silwood1]
MNEIPVIDISQLLISSSSNEDIKLAVSRAIRSACETVGFFQIVGHNIKPELFDSLVVEARRFFNQTPEEKHQYTVHKWNPANKNTYRGYFPSSIHGKEGLDLSSPYLNPEHELVKSGNSLHELNLWSMKGIFTEYWDEMWRIGLELMRAVARAFNLDASYFDNLLDDQCIGGAGNISTLRLNYYPKQDNPIAVQVSAYDNQPLSCEEHCDGALFTILYQYEIGGLQVEMRDGTWTDVPVIPYGLVVNTGRCLERWTNGHLKAVNHRVKLLKEGRISIPFFLEACYTTPIVMLPTIDEKPKYEPTSYGQYIIESNKQFKEYQRDNDKPI